MQLDVITIFPEYLAPLRQALLGKAIASGIVSVDVHNLRDWATDVHKSVDDTPYGGGPGMVMKPQVWGAALDEVAKACAHNAGERNAADRSEDTDAGEKPLLIVPTPAGRPFNQQLAQQWAQEQHIVFACGRYEGIDQRVITEAAERYRVEEVSIGDYVLIGGEVATLVIAEAITRLIPGVLGNQRSHEEDSFSDGLLEGPAYTKPQVWRGHEVPGVLLSGDHGAISRWRRDQSLLRTASRRPDLLTRLTTTGALSLEDRLVVASAHWRDYDLDTLRAELKKAHPPTRRTRKNSGGNHVAPNRVVWLDQQDWVLAGMRGEHAVVFASSLPPVPENSDIIADAVAESFAEFSPLCVHLRGDTWRAIAPARRYVTVLNVLVSPAEMDEADVWDVPGVVVTGSEATPMHNFCEAENMLTSQFEQLHGVSPRSEVVHQLRIMSFSGLVERDVTQAIVSCFSKGVLWYGTTSAVEG